VKINKELSVKLGTQEAHAIIAEAWFKFLGYTGATAIFHAAAEKVGSYPLVILKWVCYLLLFNWVNYQINKLIWFAFPSTDIVNAKPSDKAIGISVFVSSVLMLCIYKFVFYLFEVFVKK